MYKKYRVNINDYKIVETLKGEVNPEEITNEIEEGLIPGDEADDRPSAEFINEAVEKIPETIKSLYVNSEYFNTIIKKLHSSFWNNKTPKERKDIFLEIQGYTSYMFGKDLVSNQIMFTDRMIDDEYVYMEEGNTYIYEKLFDSKNAGISILSNYIYALTRDLIITLGDNMYNDDVKASELSTKSRDYYENLQSSYLYGSWTNMHLKGDKYYYSQPIVHDALILSKEIMIEHVKYLYKEFGYIDQEMSSLINQHMNEVNNRKQLNKKRREAVLKAKENIKLSVKEMALYDKYLEQSASPFSKLSDDEFYELFNMAYVNALNSNEDGLLTVRIDNMINELLKRTFKNFDLTNIELPKYKTIIDEEKNVIQIGRIYNGETSLKNCSGSGEALTIVLGDIVMLSQKYVLFDFSSEKEKIDYYTMKEWTDLKNHDYSDSVDSEIVKDGLNIILRKTNELMSDINSKIKKAISKSKFIPHGKSMIAHDNKDALYDYHEFKNLYTKDEITEGLMEYIRLDIEEMKKNKNNIGGRK